jgi:chromosome segregation ATPase
MASLEARVAAEAGVLQEQYNKALAESAQVQQDVEELAQEAQALRVRLAEALALHDALVAAHAQDKEAWGVTEAQLRQELADALERIGLVEADRTRLEGVISERDELLSKMTTDLLRCVECRGKGK